MLFDFSHADHSGHIIEIDQIQNTAWASASSASKIDLLTILQSKRAAFEIPLRLIAGRKNDIVENGCHHLWLGKKKLYL